MTTSKEDYTIHLKFRFNQEDNQRHDRILSSLVDTDSILSDLGAGADDKIELPTTITSGFTQLAKEESKRQ